MVDRLQRCERNEPFVRFDTAWLVSEVVIKYTTVVALSLLEDADPQRSQRIAYTLVREDSIGGWVSALDHVASRLARLDSEPARKVSRVVLRRIPAKDEPEHYTVRAMLHASQLLRMLELIDDERTVTRRPSLLSLFQHLATIRNKTRGHGAFTTPFYTSAAPLLMAAAYCTVNVARGFGDIALITHQDQTDRTVALQLRSSSPTRTVYFPRTGEPGSVWFIPSGSQTPVQMLPLMFVDPVTFETSFVNGSWNESSLNVSTLNYETGKSDRQFLPRYKGAAAPPPSSTEGGHTLVWDHAVAHNLPPPPTKYVARPGLEDQLEKLLRDPVHRLISLNGPGGSGKTSLALAICHQLLTNNPPFDFIIWVSARDIDLLLEGPAPRERQVRDLDTFARYLCKLLDWAPEQGEEMQAIRDFLSDTRIATLLVVDNLETLDDPAQLQRYLDETVILPSKVLITSRHERFRGDFPIPVRGMEENEARQLITSAARDHYCEGQISEAVIQHILRLSDRLPYVIKLLVAQFAVSGNILRAYDQLEKHEELLQALFDGSFALLPTDGQWLYLLLAHLRQAPQWLLGALCEFAEYSFPHGCESLLKHSLVTVTSELEDEDEYHIFEVAHLAVVHGRRMSVGHELEADVDRAVHVAKSILDQAQLQAHGVVRALHPLWSAISHKRAIGILSWNQAVEMAQAISKRIPACWLPLAQACADADGDSELVRSMYKRAVEADPLSCDAWKAFSDFERSRDSFTAARYGARAIDCGYGDLHYAVYIAGELARELSRPELGVTAAQRAMYVAGVAHFLEQRKHQLNATGLSRLGWLYLIRWSPDTDPDKRLVRRAYECAELGLRLEPDNRHCLQLLQRTERELQ